MRDSRKVVLLAVGDELLDGRTVNTSGTYLGHALTALSYRVVRMEVLPDEATAIGQAVARARQEQCHVILTGGLGPTGDDLTREALAESLGEPLVTDEEALRSVRSWFATRRLTLPSDHARQALRPRSARCLPNRQGTAPGIWWEDGRGQVVVALPGPPAETAAVWEAEVGPRLAARTGEVPPLRLLRTAGLGESHLTDLLRDIPGPDRLPGWAPYAATGEVVLRLRARSPGREGVGELDALETAIRGRLKRLVYGTGEDGLARVVGRILAERSATVSVAESCTGGRVTARLTEAPGSSAYLRAGLVVYSLRAKAQFLGLPLEVLAREQGIGRATSGLLARRVQEATGSTYGLAVTGVAGPGDAAGHPQGYCAVAVAGPRGVRTWDRILTGQRALVQERAAALLLQRAWLVLGGP